MQKRKIRLQQKTIVDIIYAFMAYVEMCWEGANKQEKRLYRLAKRAMLECTPRQKGIK
jgi:hypothetical protein